MKELIKIRKELDLSQQSVADELKIKREAYSKIEKRGCKDALKKEIITYFILECNNRAGSRKELGISQKRLAKLLGIKRSCLCMREKKGIETKGLRNVLEKERKRRMQLKDGLLEMLKFC